MKYVVSSPLQAFHQLGKYLAKTRHSEKKWLSDDPCQNRLSILMKSKVCVQICTNIHSVS